MPNGDAVTTSTWQRPETWKNQSGESRKNRMAPRNLLPQTGRNRRRVSEKANKSTSEANLRRVTGQTKMVKRYTTGIIVEDMKMLGDKPAGQNNNTPSAKPTE